MEVIVKILFRDKDKAKIKAIQEALEPDNTDFPQGIKFYFKSDKNSVTYILETEISRMLTLRNTVDDILESIEAIEHTLDNIRDKTGNDNQR